MVSGSSNGGKIESTGADEASKTEIRQSKELAAPANITKSDTAVYKAKEANSKQAIDDEDFKDF
jgi:hypothetical protein